MVPVLVSLVVLLTMVMTMMSRMFVVAAAMYVSAVVRLLPFQLSHPLLHCSLIEGLCFPLENLYGAGRTVGKTSTQAVTINIADQYCLAIHDFNGAFVTGIHT